MTAPDAEDGAQLLAASEMYPTYIADIPERSGLIHKEPTDD